MSLVKAHPPNENKCMVCLYRKDGFDNGGDFPINDGAYSGIVLSMNARVCTFGTL